MIHEYLHAALLIAFSIWIVYLISGALRRKQKIQLQNRLIDRFSTAADLAAFLETEGGKVFMGQLSDKVSRPTGPLMAAASVGVVLLFLGAGLIAISLIPMQSTYQLLHYTAGVLVLFVGAGFMAAAALSWWLSRRLDGDERRK